MANPNDNLYRLYQNGLKHFSLPDFDTFKQDMMDEQKRRRFYTNMQDAYSLPDFDTFSKDIGTVAPPPAAAPAQPAAQAQPQQQAVTPTVKSIKDNTAQQTSVQSAATPAQPTGWKPSPVQQQYMQFQMDQANARLKKMGEDFHQRMEGIEKGNRPGSFMGEREFNPQTGQMEKVFYTTQGERVPTQMQKIKADSEYHQWWENNTEAGKRSKEQRLQREFDARLSGLWQRHNPTEGENAAEQAWSAAEKRQGIDRNRIAEDIYHDRGDAMSNAAFLGGRENHIMNAAENSHRSMVAHFTNFDLDRLMNESWDNLGEDGQKALIDDCYQMLRYRNPGADELVLYNQAKQFARQQSDLRLYNLAVEKNMPKGNLEYLMRKIGDMNLLMNVSKGLAVSSADGKTGDMAANEAANEIYRQDGHKILDVTGMVAGFALDPTTWLSAGVGSAATRGTMWLGGRWLAGRGASAAVTQAATRQFATSMTGRIVGGIAGGSANFGTFEGVKEMENQFAHGGKVATMDENGNLLREGRYVNEGYSASAVGGQTLHGLMMGGAVGWLGPVTGNVSDKLVRGGELLGKAMPGVSSTAGKVMTRAGVYTGATLAEGTIFSVPEWIEGKRDAIDVWNDNMAMMVGFKAKHMLKSAGGVLGDLKASFDSPTNGQKNRLDFESRLRQRMDAPSDGGMGLTEDEKAELKRYGYDLRDLVESSERTGDAAEGSLIAQNAPEIVSRLTDMVTDPRISEAARAKMYYFATGRRLPMSTVMRGELIEDGDGGFIVESQGANGVITSRSFKSRKAADLELERIKRQTELNSIETGERYQQTADFENRLQEACRTVAAENGWDMVEVYRTCEEARRNHLRGGDEQFDEVQQNILRKVTDAMGEFEETGATDAMRDRINEKYGVDIDGAIRKEASRRTLQEQTAIDEYLNELIPDKAKEANPVEDAQAEDITNQKLLSDEPAEPQGPAEGEPIDPRFDNSTPAPDYDPHQPNGDLWPTGRAVMKFQDRPVEVLSGRVVMMEDGTMVDKERSDASIVIRDLATGEIEMVSPDAILSYEAYPETLSVEEVEAMQGQGAEAPQPEVEPQSKYTSGQIKIRNSDGTETRGVLTGYVDENGNHEYYVEGDLQHLHYASEQELNNILSEYQPDEPQQPTAEQPQAADRVYTEGVTDTEAYDNGLEDGAASTSMSDEELNSTIARFNDESEVSMLTDYGRGWVEGLKEEQQRRIQAAQPEQTEQPEQPEQVAPIEPTPAPTSTPTPTTTPTSTPAEAPQGEVTMPTGVNPVGTIAVPQRDGSTRTFTVGKDAEGQNVLIDDRGFMWAHDGNGNAMQPYSPGANVPTWTDEQLSKLGAVQPSNEQPATVPSQPESVPASTETPQNPVGNAVSNAESVPNTATPVEDEQETPAPTAEPTPLQRIPRDAKGEPIFEQAENPEHGWDALVEFAEGDAATAKEIADTMAEEKRKAYEKAQKQKPKGKTPTEILASKKAISAGLAQAEQEYNLWQQMANVEQRRQDAIRAQQEAEARQRAAERAEAEKAEREAREEAARLEREALEGIPEWHLDTPENARKRGVRRFSGQMFTRQEPVQGVVGHEVDVKFSQKDLPKGHVAVIEASQLQPSHIQGQRNPMFFIEEAQPKNRAEAVSMFAAKEMAEGIRPQEITGSATAYTGAPTINSRGEVIQGNNRSDALRYLWENKLPEQQQTYKQYLIDNAEQFGIDPEAVNAMQQPVLVNMLDVDDAEAIRLGQMTAQDTESGGVERIKPKNVAQKLGEDMRSFAAQLLRSGDEEASFGQLVDRNGTDVLKWMAQKGAITNTQYQSAFDSKGNLTAEAKNDLQKVLYQAVFKEGSQQLEEMFDALPAKAQRAILSTAFRDMDSPFAGKMLPEIQASIAAFNQLMNDPTFAAAKKMEEVLRVVEGFKRSIQLDDRFEQYMPADNFSNFALHLAAMYKANDMSQSTLTSYFNQMYDLAQGKKAATLFEEADTTEYPLADVIKQVLNIDYKPAKNGNNNVANGGADVALRNQNGQGGELRGNEPPASGEQNPAGTEPSDRGAGASDDSRGVGERRNLQPSEKRTEGETSEIDENGLPFVVSENGTTSFGVIREESGLPSAPIKLSEGYQDENGKGYGLRHIEAGHGDEIRNAGFSTVEEFVSYVAKNYDEDNIRVGKQRRNGNTTYLIQVTDSHDNTLFIELSRDGSYWNVNSGGVFRKGYSNKKETVAKTEPQQPNNAVSSDSSLSTDEQSGTSSIEPNGESTVSNRKVNNSASEKQVSGQESSLQPSDNKGEQTVQTAVEAASAQVNTEPTPAQAEAGNYKKGHVTIGEFDITIENPAGSVRKGVDADGKEWHTTMANAYGYIKGTESADGDPLDVFLHEDMDQWNGRKVFVVDQTNTDGSFDEHKVMLGFNDKDEAMSAYLANYDKTWAETHPGLRISEANVEDFEKWVESSKRKRKPFAEYTTVNKVVDEAPVKAEPQQPEPIGVEVNFSSVGKRKPSQREALRREVAALERPELLEALDAITESERRELEERKAIKDEQAAINKQILGLREEMRSVAERQLTKDELKALPMAKRRKYKEIYSRYEKLREDYEGLDQELNLTNPKSRVGRIESRRLGWEEFDAMVNGIDISPLFHAGERVDGNDEVYGATKELLESAGIEVVEVGDEEAQVMFGNRSGDERLMGSRTDRKMKKIAERFADKELDDNQRAVVDVFSGNRDNVAIEVERADGKVYMVLQQGRENKAGVKHSLFRHFETRSNYYSIDEIALIPEIIYKGQRKSNGKIATYDYTNVDGVRLRVTTELKAGKEFFTNFIAKRKPRVSETQVPFGDTQLSAGVADTEVSDAKISEKSETGKPKFLKTHEGTVYGWTVGGKVYLNRDAMNPETPLHEYTHLWDEMVRRENPELWARGVELMKQTPLWQEVMNDPNYAYIRDDEDAVASEVHSRLTGKEGARLLQDMIDGAKKEGPLEVAEKVTLVERLKRWLSDMFKTLKKTLGKWSKRDLDNLTPEDFTRMTLRDLAEGLNPDWHDELSGTKFYIIGERGIVSLEHTVEAGIRLDNLAMARNMEKDKKNAQMIRTATGWERGSDGLWRYEMPDFEIDLNGLARKNSLWINFPWGKDFDRLSQKILDGEDLTEEENIRFDKLSERADEMRKIYEESDAKYLDDYVIDKDLFKAYPEFRQIRVEMYTDTTDGKGGSFVYDDNLIRINTSKLGNNDTEELRSILAHEVQHAIQRAEGFARGGNPETAMYVALNNIAKNGYFLNEFTSRQLYELSQLRRKAEDLFMDGEFKRLANAVKHVLKKERKFGWNSWMDRHDDNENSYLTVYNALLDYTSDELHAASLLDGNQLYNRLSGEVEARNVQTRLGMSTEERRNTLLSMTEDVEREDQIFIISGIDRNFQESANVQEDKRGPRYRFSGSKRDFDELRERAVRERGIVMPGLNEAEVRVVDVPRHDFAGTGKQAIEKARTWAKNNIIKNHWYHKDRGDGFQYRIDEDAIGKYLSSSSTKGSDNLGIHLAVLKRLPSIIDDSIEAEIHADYAKANGKRTADNGVQDSDILVHRYYGAAEIDGKLYRVKTTIKENRGGEVEPYNYQVTELELLISGSEASDALSNSNRIDVAKLLKGVEKSYDPGKKLLEESEKVDEGSPEGDIRFREAGEMAKLNDSDRRSVEEFLRAMPSVDVAVIRDEEDVQGVSDLSDEAKSELLDILNEGKTSGLYCRENKKIYIFAETERGAGEFTLQSIMLHENAHALADADEQADEAFLGRFAEAVGRLPSKFFGSLGEKLLECGYSEAELPEEIFVLTLQLLFQKPKAIERLKENLTAADSKVLERIITKQYGKEGRYKETVIDGFKHRVEKETDIHGHRGASDGTRKDVGESGGRLRDGSRVVDNEVANREGDDYGAYSDEEVSYLNDPASKALGRNRISKRRHAEKLAKKFNTPIQVVTDPKELTSDNAERQARMRRSKGFYHPATGKVIVVLPNNANVEDVAETVFHEVVAHKGLREMLGDENYDAFCDEVYDHLKDDLKEEVDRETTRRFEREPEKGYEHHRRVSVDEMFGRMAEKGFEDFTKAERGIWAKLKAKVLEAINKFLGSLKLPKWVKLGDNELRYMLWRSHEKLRTKGDYVDMARDAAKREELGLSAEARFRDGETGDIWKDQSVGLQERITNAAIRLSNNQSGDLTLRNDAQKAVVNNLQSLLHSMRNRRGTAQSFIGADRKVEAGVVDAMNAQAMFDRATVKRVSDLARILMQNGYLSGMTSGEMQRLLSAVKNSTAMHDISDSVQKIMDIMVNNQLRNAEGALRQLLSIRGSKVDARGVEVQGVLDVEGQCTMEVVKKAMSLTEDDINDRIAEALNRMSDPDQTIADKAALEYAGLNMTLDYVQNIAGSKSEEKTLRDSLKTAKEDRDAGRMTDDAYKQFVEATEDAIRKNKVERAEAYFNLVGRLSDSLRESIENAKAFREAEKARVSEIHHNANSDMEGRPTNEHHKDDWKDKFVNNGFVQFLFAPLGTFDQILRVFGNKSANGEGYLWNRFMRGWVDCRNKELTGVKKKFARLDEKAAELFGKGKTWGNLIRMEAKMPKATVSFWDGGEMRDHELTQGNLLYIYMVDKMTDGRMKLRRMGITESDIAKIENFLDPRFKALGDWLQDEFLVDTRNEYNETHKRMFGASMAAIENYFPLKILANARVDKEEDVNQQNRPDGITTKTGSIIKRRVNNLALDITGADALSVILDHITQMEHWSAYAEWNRDLNTLRTYKRFRNQVINMTTVYGGGRKLWENFNDLCLMAAGEYRPPISRLNKNAVNLAKGVTAAKVSFRMYTALKQFLSAPAYAPEVSMRAIAKSIANPYGDFKWCLENMPIFRERWHSRISGDPRLLKSDMDWKMWRSRIMEISSRIGMTPNAFVDAVTVSIGARAMYETRLKQYLKEGYPTDAAEKRAMQDATILFNQTQQSSESPFLSTMQVDKDWLSTLFTVFRNSSMSYTRQTYDGARNLKHNLTPGQRAKSIEFMTKQILRDWNIDPDAATDAERGKAEEAARSRFKRQIKKDVIRLATFGYVLEWLWNLGPYLPYIIFGYYISEKDKMWDDVFTHSYFGSIEGLTGGDVMSSFGNMWASGEWNWNQLSKDMPLASDINTIGSKFVGGKNAEAINDILNLLVQMGVGINPQSITDTAIAITDACGDDPALSHEAAIFAMRVLQVPQSQIDKMYFDEVDLRGEEASKLTPAQLAQRYAEYKVKRGTPLAPWSWGDEERLGKYNDLATDRMKERLDAQGDATVIEAYADFEARYKAMSEKAKEAKELMKTDYAAAAQAHAALQQDPDFILYQRFGALDKQLGRISKMWLTSKSPAEAALVASTISSYRSGMVKVLQAETVESQQSAMSELTTLMNDFYAKYQGMQPKQVNR